MDALKKVIVPLLVILVIAQFSFLSLAFAAPTHELQQKIFVHYAKTPEKPSPPTKTSGTYTVFAKWNLQDLPIEYEINPSGSGLQASFAASTIELSANEWDDGAYSTWGGVSSDLFSYAGASTLTYADLAWTDSDLDGKNTIVWGNYPQSGVIAVTLIWYSNDRQIIEFDMVFDTNYKWGNADTDTGAFMDLQNIATHELGHAVGLGDLYRRTTTQETMYGYANYAETIKRDLYNGDKAGIKSLYG